MKRCLVDLDGVLVDFVGGALRHHGLADPYHSPANCGKYHVENLVGMEKALFFQHMDEEFWANLEPTPECFEIVRTLELLFGAEQVCICTSPILTHGCYEGKLRWIRQHVPQFSRRFLVGPPKEFAAGPDTWLVDDSERNTRAFLEWGGNVILIPRPWNSLHSFSWSPCRYLASQLLISGVPSHPDLPVPL